MLPELGLTGYTCGDLFLQDTLLRGAEEALATVLEATRNLEVVDCRGSAGADTTTNCIIARRLYKKERFWAWFPRPICPITANFTKSASLPPRRRSDDVLSPSAARRRSLRRRAALLLRRRMPELTHGHLRSARTCGRRSLPPSDMAQAGATVICNLSASNEAAGQGRLPPSAGHRPVCQAPVRLSVRQRRRGRVHLRYGVRRPPADRGKRRASGREAV